METDKFLNRFLLIILVFGVGLLSYVIYTDFVYKTVNVMNYSTIKSSSIKHRLNKENVYYVKLYKDKIGETRYKFNRVEIDTFVEKDFKHINKCKFNRFSVLTDNGFTQLKVRDQNPYEKIYVTIPKDNMYIIVSNYLLTVKITDTKKLSGLVGLNNRLSLKPIEIRTWLNIRDKEMNLDLLDRTNEDLADVGLKIEEYRRL